MDVMFRRVMAVRRPVVFRTRNLMYGWVYPEIQGGPIYINLARHGDEDPTITYLHECLHCIFPEKSEEDITKLTEQMWKTMTTHQRFVLSRKLFRRAWVTEEV